MIVSPVQMSKIEKEANIARFLSRLLPVQDKTNYDSLSWDNLVVVDTLLDFASNPGIIEIVDKELKRVKGDYVAGDFSVADVVIYSAIHAVVVSKGLKVKDIPPAVQKWMRTTQNIITSNSS
jgi:hypothetical protein